MDKLEAMRTYVAIVDHGSLTAAAEALGRSLPTVVRVLAVLEESLGTRLLRRTTRRMSLTPEGQTYLERCRHILTEVEDAELSVTRDQREPRGIVRMTAPVLFGQMHVAPAVSDFLRRYREVRVELLLLDRVVNIVEEGVDIAVRIANLADSTMIAVPVGHVRRVVCASPGLLGAVGTPTDPHDLAARQCVQFSGTAEGGVWTFSNRGRDLPVKISGSFTCNQATAAIQACADGLGFGCFLSYQIEPLVQAGQLRIVLKEFEPPAIPVSLVYPEVRLISTRLRVLIDWLRASLGNRPEIHRAAQE